LFQKTAVIGLGCIGASVGMAVRARGLSEEIRGFDISPDACIAAVKAGAVDETGPLEHLVPESDFIILAVPPSAMPVLFRQLAPLLIPETVITDTAGVKQVVGDWARLTLPANVHFVPGHPIAGSELPGIAGARADMFEGAYWILTPGELTAPHALETVKTFAERLGAKPLLMDAKTHDEHFALLSHLPNLLANVLLKMASGLEHPEVGGGSWRDLTRVGGTHPDLWTEILSYNREATLTVLSQLQADLGQIQDWLAESQTDRLRDYLRKVKELDRQE